jgi:peptide chain release factor 2
MLFDELQEKLKTIEPDLNAIITFYANAKIQDRFSKSEKLITDESFWQHPDQIKISKEHQKLKALVEEFTVITQGITENKELITLFQTDEEELTKLQTDIRKLCKKISAFKLSLFLNQPEDDSNCFLNINAGAGGTESQDWAQMLLRMYVRFCEREELSVEILDYQAGEEAGIKGATLYIKGTNAFGLLKAEFGVHRLVRISPFNANKRRHTSFAAITGIPEIIDEKVAINETELRIDTYRAGGAGGQHVNKTDSAVRITHLPTGIVVQCQNERSQTSNKQTAMKMLMAKLVEKQEHEIKERDSSVEKKKIEWGSQIRSYVLHPYKMVKDHRTEHESPQPELVLDGELMEFIEAYLVQFCTI